MESITTNDKPVIAVYDDWGSVSRALTTAGAIVLQVDTNRQSKQALKHADAIVLTGGGDVDPARYGALNRHRKVYGVNADRDAREFGAVKHGIANQLPMFGICRGLQLLNVAHGGSLTQHIYDNAVVMEHEGVTHEVKIRSQSRVGQALGTGHLLGTSIHHQAVARMGNGLLPAGWTHDGTVEMIESVPGRPYVLATQFHPEMDYVADDVALGIFEHFVRVVRETMRPDPEGRARQVKYMKYTTKVYKPTALPPTKTDHAGSWYPQSTNVTVNYGRKAGPYTDLDDGDWKWDESQRMWIPVEHDDGIMSAADRDRWNDDDYSEWDALNTLGLAMQSTCDETCVLDKCVNPKGCMTWNDCEAEAIRATEARKAENVTAIVKCDTNMLGKTLGDYVASVEAVKRGHKR